MAATPAAASKQPSPRRKKPTREQAQAAADRQRKQEQENSHKALIAEPYTCQVCLAQTVPEPAAPASFPIKFHICEHKACSTCWFVLEKSKRDKCAGCSKSAGAEEWHEEG